VKRDLALWTSILGGPVIWALTFICKFFLSYWTCVYQWKPAVYVISATGLAMTAGVGLLAWAQWQKLGREYPGDGGGAIARSRAMALVGMLQSAFFFVVIIANALPELMLRGCE
jgi:hypothetical protein